MIDPDISKGTSCCYAARAGVSLKINFCRSIASCLMRNLKLITASILAILVAIIVVQNREPVATHVLFATVVMPHAILLFITAAAGFALGVLLTLYAKQQSGTSVKDRCRFPAANRLGNRSARPSLTKYVRHECRTPETWAGVLELPGKS